MPGEMYKPFIIGDKIYLRGLEKDDVDKNWFNWFNDNEVTRYMANGAYPNTRESLISYYETMCVNNPNDLVLAIIEKDSNLHVGNIGIHRFNWRYRRAELGIILGERSAWGKGYGTEACKLICRHCFDRFGFHKIFLRTEEQNKGAVRMFEKAGFKTEAILRDEILREGRWYNSVYMGMIAEEFMAEFWQD